MNNEEALGTTKRGRKRVKGEKRSAWKKYAGLGAGLLCGAGVGVLTVGATKIGLGSFLAREQSRQNTAEMLKRMEAYRRSKKRAKE